MSKFLSSPEFWVYVPVQFFFSLVAQSHRNCSNFSLLVLPLAGWCFNENKPQIAACHSLTNILSEVKQLKVVFPLERTRNSMEVFRVNENRRLISRHWTINCLLCIQKVLTQSAEHLQGGMRRTTTATAKFKTLLPRSIVNVFISRSFFRGFLLARQVQIFDFDDVFIFPSSATRFWMARHKSWASAAKGSCALIVRLLRNTNKKSFHLIEIVCFEFFRSQFPICVYYFCVRHVAAMYSAMWSA